MAIDPAIISSMSALLGALAGGGASLAAAVYTQRFQDRLQRISQESAKRESVYAEFIMTATAVLLNAYVEDQPTLGRNQEQLFGITQRIRLFAPPAVVEEAENVVRRTLEIALQPPLDLRAAADLAKSKNPDDLEAFSRVCRKDLDGLHLGFR